MEYSFCETLTAGSNTPWHIRKLTTVGRKLGGGADTPALCGRVVAWDIRVAIDEQTLPLGCERCQTAYRAEPK